MHFVCVYSMYVYVSVYVCMYMGVWVYVCETSSVEGKRLDTLNGAFVLRPLWLFHIGQTLQIQLPLHERSIEMSSRSLSLTHIHFSLSSFPSTPDLFSPSSPLPLTSVTCGTLVCLLVCAD